MESLGKLFETDKLVSLAINIIINCIFFYLNKRKIDVLEEQNLILMDRVNNLEKNLSNLINFINGGQPLPQQQSLQKTQPKTQIQRPNISPPQTQTIVKSSVQLPMNAQNAIPQNATSGLRKSMIVEPDPKVAQRLDDKSQSDLNKILEEEEEKERLLNEKIEEPQIENVVEVSPQIENDISDVGDPDDIPLSTSVTLQSGLKNPDKKKSYAGMEIDE